MRTEIYSASLSGIEASPVVVEVDIAPGIGIHLVGLPDSAVKESLLRTVTALNYLGFHIPGKRIVINLAPADMQKKGSGYDVPIALGIIAASGQLSLPFLKDFMVMGELSLDGSVRYVPGALPVAEYASRNGFTGCIFPEESAYDTLEFADKNVYAVRSLIDVVQIVKTGGIPSFLVENVASRNGRIAEYVSEDTFCKGNDVMDFSEIIGQENAKRGLEIAAAGGHNVLMIGPPGSGKSSLAKAMSAILPPLTKEEALQTNKIYSVSGGVSRRGVKIRPFRSPHYNISMSTLLGGGSVNIMPGEVSLAHNGVLFIDEFAELPRAVAEALRGPLEDRVVEVSRVHSKVRYPASFMLVAATNPCPCGYYGEGDKCTCPPARRHSYLSKLSGPLMDRIDLHLWLHPVPPSEVARFKKGETSMMVAKRVSSARDIQLERFRDEGIFMNSEMSMAQIRKFCPLDKECVDFMKQTMEVFGLSVRAFARIIKIARTIADLEGTKDIQKMHLCEAVGYRFLDKNNMNM